MIQISCSGSKKQFCQSGTPMIEEILSSFERSPVKVLDPAAEPLESPVLESEQASTENNSKKTPAP